MGDTPFDVETIGTHVRLKKKSFEKTRYYLISQDTFDFAIFFF